MVGWGRCIGCSWGGVDGPGDESSDALEVEGDGEGTPVKRTLLVVLLIVNRVCGGYDTWSRSL